jgi:VCBS repeat-containing protein
MTTTSSSVTTTLATTVDNLTLTGTADINGTGNALANVITGNTGANVLDGKAGADTLAGGLGNDTYVVDNAGDVVVEYAGEGSDTVQSSISYTLGDELENLTLTGTANINGTGNALDNVITGNGGNNTLSGLAGNDTLAGGAGIDVLDGGSGADDLQGGLGDDTYIVDQDGDLVTEAANAGIDTVKSDISYSLGDNVENLTLLGAGNLDGTGNALNNILTGNAGNNLLASGAGADTVYAGDGNDSVFGGDGNDVLAGEAGDDQLFGEAGNDTLNGGTGADNMQGGSGDDTYLVDDAGDLVIEDSAAGTDAVQSSISYTLTDNVENLALTGTAAIDGIGNELANVVSGNSGANTLYGLDGDDVLNGNAGNDSLFGATGNDTLDGGAGVDRMEGATGDDTYVVDNAADSVFEIAGEGTDTVRAGISYTLTDSVENLVLTTAAGATATGNELDNVITGNSGNDTLYGLDGNDTLVGNAGSDTLDGGLGADNMQGGAGNDIYVVNESGDIVTEALNAGTDTVKSDISYTLTDNVDNLTLAGSDNLDGTGNALNNVLTGNGGNNTLSAEAGNDTVNAGDGNDVVLGGDGGDTLRGEAGDDQLSGDAGNDILDGGSGADQLAGGLGNDVLDGGTGGDQMAGGAGDDSYVVDDNGDIVTEDAGAGTDLVQSSITYTLTDNVENLTLTGSANIDGSGNELNNIINGNTGVNVLDGRAGDDTINAGTGNDTLVGGDGNDALNGEAGDDQLRGDAGNDTLNGGTGADAMAGGSGNDTYIVDNAGDLVVESQAEGTDIVQSSITYTLTDNVENLTLTGSASTNGTGNALDNVIIGNGGNNVLQGLDGKDTLVGNAGNDTLDGGTGVDTMQGGTGNDTYVVDNAGDLVTENTGEGVDLAQSSIDYTLTANVENLTLTGDQDLNGTGNALSNVITGNSGNNTISAEAGNDTVSAGAGNDVVLGGDGDDALNGEAGDDQLSGDAGNDRLDGGAGADQMAGGIGNDTYVVDDNGDIVTEAAAAGIDLVQSSITYTLTDNVENLTLTGAADIDGTGNELNNIINGNTGANLLDGRAGDDTINAGTGNDILVGGDGNDALNGEAGDDQLSGDAGNDTLNGGAGADAMAGGSGNDTYVVDNAGDLVVESQAEGTDLVQAGITYTLTDNVENLTLTGTANIDGAGNALDNVVTGNAGNNVLRGLDGNDTLVGAAGNDILDGGAGVDNLQGGIGNDTYVIDDANDVVTEAAGAGVDLVQASVSTTLSANVENLTLTGDQDLNGTGNALGNAIVGNAGANLIDGGAGIDSMSGGAGDDTYIVDVSGDVIVEAAGAGTDIAYAGASYTLSANVENLVLTGTAAISGSGNALDNNITGNGADNVLNGLAGSDVLTGGAGNDTYVVDNAGDLVVENQAEGSDTVQSSISYTLTANVENLTLTGSANLDGTGNALNNVITGNGGNNLLQGLEGNDTLVGGAGNDTYIVDAGDTVVEAAASGIDTVLASSSHVLAANVENLVLTGSGDLAGTGNALANAISGNAGANLLDGGLGADTLAGGAGDDTYIVDNAGDVVSEAAGSGVDTVYASVSSTLAANVENLVLTGSGNINATGNAGDNSVTGNSGANTLAGGAGSDVLAGGAGNDTYVFQRGDGADRVIDAQGSDVLRIGGGLTAADLEATRSGDDLVISVTGSGDSITLVGWLAQEQGVGTIVFDNGSTLDWAGIEELAHNPPVANADALTVQEDDGRVELAASQLLANDTVEGTGEVLSVVAVGESAAGATLALDGATVQYDLGGRFDALAQGEVLHDSFSYTISNTSGETSTAQVAVEIVGVNDGPVAAADAAQVSEDGAATASGNVLANDSDVDHGTVLQVAAPGTIAGVYGNLSIAADGDYSYTLNSGAANVQALGADEVVVEHFTYVATDGIAGVQASLDITVTGSNDGPVAAADVAQVSEDSQPAASGNVLANDSDVDHGTVLQLLAPGTIAGVYGSLTLAGNGDYSYTLNSDAANVQALAADQVAVEHFTYVATDGTGSAGASLDITVIGTNDGPVAESDAARVSEDGQLAASGNLLANDHDVDAGALLQVVAPGTYVGSHGTLTLAQDGSYTYNLDNASSGVQSLAQGQSVVDSFAYATTDGIAQSTSALEITIAGANDGPVAAGDSAHVTEDLANTASGNVLANDHDVDAGTVLQVASPGTIKGSYGQLALAQDGSYVYTLDAATPAIQSLGRTATLVEHFGYTTTDGIASAAATLDVTISGSNDAPVVAAALADHDVTFNKAFSFVLPANSFTDADQGDTLSYSATLADGSDLPTWLKFDATTGTFSGTSPKTVGAIDVKVTATDQVAATGSTAGSLSVSDVFTLSVSHGNEGVGNGEDAPPAGHDTNQNDGPGTSPGNPGNKPGTGSSTGSGGLTVIDIDVTAGSGSKAVQASLTLTVPTLLASGLLSQYLPQVSSVGNSSTSQTFGNWLAVDLAVSAAAANSKPGFLLDVHAGTDATAVSKATAGYLGSTTAFGGDPVAALTSAGNALKAFSGLGKGTQKIK